jgi:putative FmdB family regulatory protein
MPIYAYRCSSCGHAKDVLQKMSDPVLSVCPACGASSFEKQVTAAGFQLKGSGWYVTDFRGGNNSPAAKKDEGAADQSADTGVKLDAKSDAKTDTKLSDKPSDKPAATAAPAASPAAAPAPVPKPPPAAGA